jgi:hypothetical protein
LPLSSHVIERTIERIVRQLLTSKTGLAENVTGSLSSGSSCGSREALTGSRITGGPESCFKISLSLLANVSS